MEAVKAGFAAQYQALPDVPVELVALADRVRELPQSIRFEIEPALSDAMEQAAFRSRALGLARDALERFRLDLELIRFDLHQTRLEREALRRALGRV